MIDRFAACAVLAAALAGCAAGEPDRSEPGSAPAAATPSTAEAACLAAVANEVGVGDVELIRSEVSEGTGLIAVYVDVPGAEAPWGCYATAEGRVDSVQYLGSEGAL